MIASYLWAATAHEVQQATGNCELSCTGIIISASRSALERSVAGTHIWEYFSFI
jgi:hypothetical protein